MPCADMHGACPFPLALFPSFALQLVNQIFWCQEVEEAFGRMAGGHKGAMKVGRHTWASCLKRRLQRSPAPRAFCSRRLLRRLSMRGADVRSLSRPPSCCLPCATWRRPTTSCR
jgi:hypothetical protein